MSEILCHCRHAEVSDKQVVKARAAPSSESDWTLTFTIVCFELRKFTLCIGVSCWQMHVGVLVLILLNKQGGEIEKQSLLPLVW